MLDAVFGEPEATANLIVIGDLFYERLQQQSDAALIAGNLPRSEIETGRIDLHTYLSGGKE
jgi:hypothetical protein